MPSSLRLPDPALCLTLLILKLTMLRPVVAAPVDSGVALDPTSVPNARVIVVSVLGFLIFVGLNAAIFVVARRRKLAARAFPRSAARPLAVAAPTIRAPGAVVYNHGRGFIASMTRPAPSASASGEQTRGIRDVHFALDMTV